MEGEIGFVAERDGLQHSVVNELGASEETSLCAATMETDEIGGVISSPAQKGEEQGEEDDVSALEKEEGGDVVFSREAPLLSKDHRISAAAAGGGGCSCSGSAKKLKSRMARAKHPPRHVPRRVRTVKRATKTRKLKELLETTLWWDFQQSSAADGFYDDDEFAPVIEILDNSQESPTV